MNQFYNYLNNNSYIPNNMHKCPPSNRAYSYGPYEEYNEVGELVGYYWHYGETVNLEFNIDGEITVENNAIIYTAVNQAPNNNTVGTIGQKAYNVTSLESWTCVAIDGGPTYIWEKDIEFTYPTRFGKPLYIDAETYLKGKTVQVKLFNFRYEQIYSITLPASVCVVLEIDRTLSQKLIEGIYYCTLTVCDDLNGTYIPLIKDTDCTFIVK